MRAHVSTVLACAAVLLLVALPVMAQKAFIDYDHNADFDSYKTYAFVFGKEGDNMMQSSPLMHDRLIEALRGQLNQSLREVDSDPDLAVTYHVTSKQETRIHTSGMDYGPGWGAGYYYRGYGAGWGSSTTTVSNYEVGTLVIDIYDVDKKQLIWRGTAQGTVPSKPEKAAKKIDKSIQKLANKWDKMYRGQ